MKKEKETFINAWKKLHIAFFTSILAFINEEKNEYVNINDIENYIKNNYSTKLLNECLITFYNRFLTPIGCILCENYPSHFEIKYTDKKNTFSKAQLNKKELIKYLKGEIKKCDENNIIYDDSINGIFL